MPENVQQIYTQERLPEWIQPYYEDLAASAADEAAAPYTPYGSQRLAGYGGFITPEQAAKSPELAAQFAAQQYGLGSGPWQQGAASGALNRGIGGIGGLLQGSQGLPGQAYGDLSGVAGQYGGLTGMAQGVGRQYSDLFGGIGQQFQGINTAPQSFLDADMQAYMQPYGTNVTDIAAREALRFGNIQNQELRSQAARSGAFGGARHGIREGMIDRDTAQRVSDIKTRGLQDAFNRGVGLFEGDRAAGQAASQQQMQALQGGLGAYSAGLGAQQFGLGFGQQGLAGQAGALTAANQLQGMGLQNLYGGYGQMGALAGGLGALGSQQQAMDLERFNTMGQAGTQNRAFQQAGLDIGYQDFLNQQNWPRDSLSWYGSILGGFPQNQQDTSQSTFARQPGAFQSMLGTGIAGLGVYNALQG